MIGKILGIAFCLTMIITHAAAQQGLTMGLDGGLQGTQYQLPNGKTQLLPGGSLELGYGFRLGNRWNLLSGITGGIYRTRATLPDGVIFTSYQVDDAGSAFDYSMKTVGYKETQQFFAAGVPLLLQYHTTGAGAQWYLDGGGKVFVPFNNSIKVSAAQLTLSGYYPDFNINVSNLPQHGFGTINGWKSSATTQLKPAAALSAATGFSFALSAGARFYAGVYVDYGLTGLKQNNDTLPLVTYSPTGITNVKAGSVLNRPMAGQVTSLSFGIQLKISFGSSKPKATIRTDTKQKTDIKQELQLPVDSAVTDSEYEAIQSPVLFGLINETHLPEVQRQHLDIVAHIMKQHPSIRISIVGHTCNSDTETEGKQVGTARADAVGRYLRSRGISADRLDISEVGVSDQWAPYDPPANYRNRRAVIAVK